MKMGDMAVTQQPVNRRNKLAHTMKDQKLEQMMRKNKGGKTNVMERAEKVRGCSQDLSQSQPEMTLPTVLLMPVAEMM